VDFSLADFAGGEPPGWIKDFMSLTGTLYFGNKPWSFAMGQLADQRSWLSIHGDWHRWIPDEFQLSVCVQIVDGGPKGLGGMLSLKAGANWGLGQFVLFGSLGVIIGTWKTGSDTSSRELWLQFGFKINLFWIFSLGADITLKLIYLGKHPWHLTL